MDQLPQQFNNHFHLFPSFSLSTINRLFDVFFKCVRTAELRTHRYNSNNRFVMVINQLINGPVIAV